MQITFGKYKGQEADDVIKNHPSWCSWFINQKKTQFPELMEYIEHRINKDDVYMCCGKYKDLTVNQVLERFPKYAEWVVQQKWWNEKKSNIVQFFKHKLSNHTQ